MEDLSSYYGKILGVEFELTKLDPNLLLNDHLYYQRKRIEEKVLHRMKHIEKPYNTGIVAYRNYDYLWIINGQHHTEAAIRLGISAAYYYVFLSTGWEIEKVVFNRFQKLQTTLRTLDKTVTTEKLILFDDYPTEEK